MLFFTCFSVHNDDIVSPITRRMILSIHKDVSHTTCTLSLSWIITTLASNVDGHYSGREHMNNDITKIANSSITNLALQLCLCTSSLVKPLLTRPIENWTLFSEWPAKTHRNVSLPVHLACRRIQNTKVFFSQGCNRNLGLKVVDNNNKRTTRTSTTIFATSWQLE